MHLKRPRTLRASPGCSRSAARSPTTPLTHRNPKDYPRGYGGRAGGASCWTAWRVDGSDTHLVWLQSPLPLIFISNLSAWMSLSLYVSPLFKSPVISLSDPLVRQRRTPLQSSDAYLPKRRRSPSKLRIWVTESASIDEHDLPSFIQTAYHGLQGLCDALGPSRYLCSAKCQGLSTSLVLILTVERGALFPVV